MLTIKQFTVNPLEENCYIVSDETLEAAIIDPGCFAQSEWAPILDYIQRARLTPTCCLLTHAHFDHIMGCHLVWRDLGLRPQLHIDDAPLYRNLQDQLTPFFGPGLRAPEQPPLQHCFTGEDTITLGSHTLSLIHTPGHSRGSICLYCRQEDIILTGDTLFRGSMGRTDLDGGNTAQMSASLRRLATLPPSVRVLPGHGPQTTIQNEQTWIQPTCNR